MIGRIRAMCGPGATGQASLLRPGRSTADGGRVRDGRVGGATCPTGDGTEWDTRPNRCPSRPPGAQPGLGVRVRREESLRVMAEPCAKLDSNPWCMCLVVSANRPTPGQPMSPHLASPYPGSLPKDSARRGLRPCVRPELRPPAPDTDSCTARGRRRLGPAVPYGCPSR